MPRNARKLVKLTIDFSLKSSGDKLLTTYGSLGLAAILLLLPPMVYIPWCCFKTRSRTKSVGTRQTERGQAARQVSGEVV